MTNEQWLVYLWSIYPNGGGGSALLFVLFLLSCVTIIIMEIASRVHYDSQYTESYFHPSKSPYLTLPPWKRYAVPAVLVFFMLLATLVPSRDGFVVILATPYAVEAGQSVVESLADPTSKLFKLNQLMDNALDVALEALEKK